jgi:hypothetical protein
MHNCEAGALKSEIVLFDFISPFNQQKTNFVTCAVVAPTKVKKRIAEGTRFFD